METHQPCEDCGSSDALQRNDNGSSYCHSCTTYTPPADQNAQVSVSTDKSEEFQQLTAEPKSIPDRGLSVYDTKAYGVLTVGQQIYFPYHDEDGKLVAYKVRCEGKEHYSKGDMKSAVLFGQQLFPKGSAKSITITEGEFDAIASYNMQGSKYPVVSIKNGAGNALKDCKESFEYLNSFDRIVVNFDNDEPGQAAAEEVCALFSGKSVNCKLKRAKDANEYLCNNDRGKYMDEWWEAEAYIPSGVVNGADLKDEIMQPVAMPLFSWPWDGLNLLTYGIGKGQLITITAGSGTGKTTILKQVLDKGLSDTDFPFGVLSLEEGTDTAALSLMSMYSNKRFHLPTRDQMLRILNDEANIKYKPGLPDTITDREKEEAFDQVLADGRIWFYRHNGDTSVQSVCDTIRYMSKVAGCPVILLDHISILVGMQHSRRKTSEREAIDDTLHMLRSIIEETGVTILLVSHLSRASGDVAHEEGGRVSLSHLRGSHSIAQLSDFTIAAERNTQADDPFERDITVLRLLKNRKSGEAGIATYLQWNEKTGKHVELLERVYTGDPL